MALKLWGTNDCRRGFFGQLRCRFEPRYDRRIDPAVAARLKTVRVENGCEMVDLIGNSEYVRDVCTACGRTIERVWVRDGNGVAEKAEGDAG